MALIILWFYMVLYGLDKGTFPNPTTGFLIRTISGMIIGAVLVILNSSKFYLQVTIDEDLPPSVTIVRIESDK